MVGPSITEQQTESPAGEGAQVRDVSQTLLKIQAAATESDSTAGQSRRIWLIATGGVLGLSLITFLAMAAWRLHGPPFKMLPDGWIHVTDREFGFECDFPSWYTKNADSTGGMMYNSRFEAPAWGSVEVHARKWRKKNETKSASVELAAWVQGHRRDGPLTIVADRSSDPTNPMVEFVVEMGTPGNSYQIRRRIMIKDERLLETVIHFPEVVAPENVKRAIDTVRWTR